MKKALICQGGWPGHAPAACATFFAGKLLEHGIETQVESTLDCLEDPEHLRTFALIFPCWTMGTLTDAQGEGLQAAVKSGVSLGGIHGGMGDAFRGNLLYEWMVGGHFVGHPHVGNYDVHITDPDSPITRGLPPVFAYRSEQYYLMVDPGNHVLAATEYLYEDRRVSVPVAWTKTWGRGRVFYGALGHELQEFSEFPAALDLTMRGLLWAAGELPD